MKKSALLIILAIIIVLTATFILTNNTSHLDQNLQQPEQITNTNLESLSAIQTTPDSEIKTDETGTKYILNPALVRSGGPGKGGIGIDRGIPALDESNIKYVGMQEADQWIEDNELVLAINHKGIKRVYPLQIMVWHEIANDIIGTDPIAVTYCPLCGSGIAYHRVIENQPVKFGTSGNLYNSNLIMYDDLTDTYWQQIDGKAIIGPATGLELQDIPIDTVAWRDYKINNPEAQVLSQQTGISRNYGRDPYGNYYEDSFLLFPVDNEDNRIHTKTPILGIEINGKYKAYQEDQIKELETITDNFQNTNIKLEAKPDGTITITNLDTGKEITRERDFWFAWYAFHPETELYE